MTESTKEMEGLDACFAEVVETYGRSMFALIMNAGLAQEGMTKLAAVIEKHQSRGGQAALQILGRAFNQLSNAYVQSQGWAPELLAQCERDIQRAYAGWVAVADSLIIVEH